MLKFNFGHSGKKIPAVKEGSLRYQFFICELATTSVLDGNNYSSAAGM
jgi:hypothetical protein